MTNYRLDGLSFSVFIQALFACLIAGMAVFAGMSSQLADADRRDTQTASYSVSASSFTNMKRAAAINRDAAIARASRIQNPRSKQIAILDAKAAYQNKLVSIAQKEADNTLKKPVQMFESSSDEQYITMMLFSVICSFGALFASMFHAVYINPLVAMPAFSLKAKKSHDWDSDGSNFRSADHEVSVLANKFNGMLSREKVNAKALPRTAQSDNLTSSGSDTTENHPDGLDSTQGGNNCTSRRSLNDTQKAPDKVEYSQSHYEAIKQAILGGHIKPVQKDVKKHLIALQVKFIDDAARQQKAVEILGQLKDEGVIIENPKQATTKKVLAQYVVNPDHVEEGSKAKTKPKKVIVNCPKCNELLKVSEHKLTEWGNKLKCRKCKQVFNVERANKEGEQ